jgi:hypothetical protein
VARRAPVLVLVALAAVLGGCGDDGSGAAAPEPPAAKPVGPESQGSTVQYADCGDWRRGSAAEKVATVVALRGQLTPQTSQTAESPLADDRAVEILDKACAPSYAGSLRLYKLYVRAQSFAPLGA